MRTIVCRLLIIFFFFGFVAEVDAEETTSSYQVQMQVKVPLRDGVHLNATLYRPDSLQDPLPVIFLFTPYPEDTSHSSGAYFAAHGYIYAVVDVRGRGDSEGVFDPFAHEGQDGYDIVEWFAKQPWCNGKLAMFGGSYAGGDQWLTATMRPPHLTTIVPTASAHPGVDFPASHHILTPYDVQWLALTTGHVLYSQVLRDSLWDNAAKRLYLDKASFKDIDTYTGTKSEIFQTWIRHPDLDEYWKTREGSGEQIAGVHIPVLEVTGTHDGDEPGALSFHADHDASPANAQTTYLVVGPWNHGGTRDPTQDVDSEHFGTASLIDIRRLHLQWYDYTMKGGPKPAFLQKNVMYYVAGSGAECWKSADSLSQVSSSSLTLFLDASGGAKSVYHSGVLSPILNGTTGGEWLSDPNDLSAANAPDAQPGAMLHGNGLVFHSAPFAEDTEIDGKMDLRLWLSIDAPDTDLSASLYLVTPDGKSHYLTDSALRARYRNSEEHPEPIHKNQPEEYRFSPDQPFFAERAPKGSQLRLVLMSLNDPQHEKNWNSMKPVADQTGQDARVAHIRLLQTTEHPSTLTLPLGDVHATCKASASL
jgi:uncharacterized protein